MTRKIFYMKVVSAIVVIVLLSTPAYASLTPNLEAENRIIYSFTMPRWNNISRVSPTISNSGNTVLPEMYVLATSGSAKITGTMYLEKYASGKWISVKQWVISGTGSTSLSKSYEGATGIEYRTRVVVTVSGEKADIISASCTV